MQKCFLMGLHGGYTISAVPMGRLCRAAKLTGSRYRLLPTSNLGMEDRCCGSRWSRKKKKRQHKKSAELLQAQSSSATQIIARITHSRADEGDQTRFMRVAFHRLKQQQATHYQVVIGVVAVLLLGAGSLAVYQHFKLESLKATAGEIFYHMKEMELQVARLEDMFLETAHAHQAEEILAARKKIQQEGQRYDKYVEDLGLYEDLTPERRAIYRIARKFGECEATMPTGFVTEVERYIHKWQSSKRLLSSVRRARQNGYIATIEREMERQNLPPQFFYLALQESSFYPRAVGPKTRYGYAKGIWQFIPSTAKDYGLQPGPLQHVPRYDPRDERFHFQKATTAAARYLKHLYTTVAQASGLLVMASYNWGQGNVLKKIRQLPQNPKDRNFWMLITQVKIPQETHNYVFYIISAAVISENPALFGFNFSNPFPDT